MPIARNSRPARCGLRCVAEGGSCEPRTSENATPARSIVAPPSWQAVMPPPCSLPSPAGRSHASRRNVPPISSPKVLQRLSCRVCRYPSTCAALCSLMGRSLRLRGLRGEAGLVADVSANQFGCALGQEGFPRDHAIARERAFLDDGLPQGCIEQRLRTPQVRGDARGARLEAMAAGAELHVQLFAALHVGGGEGFL